MTSDQMISTYFETDTLQDLPRDRFIDGAFVPSGGGNRLEGAVRRMQTSLCKDNEAALCACARRRHLARAAARLSLKLVLSN